jgi:hypothetical protein
MKTSLSEFGIFCATTIDDIDADKFTLTFESNIYLEDSHVWWTHAKGKSGGPLESFIARIRLKRKFVLGPPKEQPGWPLEKLDSLGAVGLYAIAERTKDTAKKASSKRSQQISP